MPMYQELFDKLKGAANAYAMANFGGLDTEGLLARLTGLLAGKSPTSEQRSQITANLNAARKCVQQGALLGAMEQVSTALKLLTPDPAASTQQLMQDATAELIAGVYKWLTGQPAAATKVKDPQVTWDGAQRRFSIRAFADKLELGDVSTVLLNNVNLEAFCHDAPETPRLGVTLRADVSAGILGDLLSQVLFPGGARAEAGVVVTFDTVDGLSFGEGRQPELALPARLSVPGIDLQELVLARSPDAPALELLGTLAGGFGPAFAVLTEGGGLTIRLTREGLDVAARLPRGLGLKLGAGPISGGGVLRYDPDKREYGGVLDLRLATFGATAAGLIGLDPFSLLIVIGVHFFPRIELGFGFTLNALGGLLAINRGFDSAAMTRALQDGAVGTMLFPEDPVRTAPLLLNRLSEVFPAQPGGFIVGPMAEFGWGSQAGFVAGRVGVVVCLPAGKMLLLGQLRVGVPSVDIDERLRIVDIRADIFGEFCADHVSLRLCLIKSKISGIPISGELGFLARWGGRGDFALSVGGFFPGYPAPPELAGMRRLAVDLSPPGGVVSIHAEAYMAITANSLQFGGAVHMEADLGFASGCMWLVADALFQWAPRLMFIFRIDAGIEVFVFGESLGSVRFQGELSGTTPWRLVGDGSVDLGWPFGSASVGIGPLTWGPDPPAEVAALSPAEIVAGALQLDQAWEARLPDGCDALVRLREGDSPQLVHPLGSFVVRQSCVPLNVEIDRIGANPVKANKVWVSNVRCGEVAHVDFEPVDGMFAPGQYIDLTGDEQLSRTAFESFKCGVRLKPASSLKHGAPIEVSLGWETAVGPLKRSLMRISPTGSAANRRNPYGSRGSAEDETIRVDASAEMSARAVRGRDRRGTGGR